MARLLQKFNFSLPEESGAGCQDNVAAQGPYRMYMYCVMSRIKCMTCLIPTVTGFSANYYMYNYIDIYAHSIFALISDCVTIFVFMTRMHIYLLLYFCTFKKTDLYINNALIGNQLGLNK